LNSDLFRDIVFPAKNKQVHVRDVCRLSYRLEREKTNTTPYVLIDENEGYMKFEGESFHVNSADLFLEISDWLSSFLTTDFEKLVFDCELRYFNSSTVKLLLNMLIEMDDAKNAENVTVNWITTKDNDIIIECGEDIQEDLKHIIFNLVLKQ